MADTGQWCLIESDPGVFTQLITDMGVEGVQVEEVWDFDTLAQVEPIYGLIFLFKYEAGASDRGAAMAVDTEAANEAAMDSIFFAQQVINNACATQAILSILMNRPDVELGEELTQFREFAQSLPSDMKGLAISNSDKIRQVHNSFARSETFSNEQPVTANDNEDLFHFVSYVPIHGALYELDGLQPRPVYLGPCTEKDWLEKVRPIIEARMASYSSSEIRFNLMAVCKDRSLVLAEQLAATDRRLTRAQKKLSRLVQTLHGERDLLSMFLSDEREKLARYRTENARRKHNYIPLIYTLLQQLAAKGKLADTLPEARQKAAERKARQRQAKQPTSKP
ncbi:ubiquitin carboxyl-terminal hydrolase [Syncephalis pseudoplumigaleata]|uniref:Ubiquitin carboxyl-terminal hydrolase n=1 Tax=Syncephalis pseudoplumigaleata TaxID=1712513 RepID=A0A4P9Z143_9FUNG|nr:ubiquitin carboxyl-terminal hydrolase [Syncephalis pseudoplumigaleata]|eukprot:RKP26187.1 ubiquitin carboxyl-terminal hydrolase [Syncephalis pseudoplumigaleata]